MNSGFDTPDGQQKKERRGFYSLRIKYVLSTLLIVLISVSVMGYFVFNRSQNTSNFFVQQFDIIITQQIESDLGSKATLEANKVATFFKTIDSTVKTVGGTTEIIISGQPAIPQEGAWNAGEVLTRLPNGSWDNPNTETAAIFIPSRESLEENIISELNKLKGLDVFTSNIVQSNPDILAIYFGSEFGTTVYYPNIDLAALVPPDFDVTGRPWYLAAKQGEDPEKAEWSVPYQDAALNGLVITSSLPVRDRRNNFRGVVGVDVQLLTITQEISKIRIGDTGYAFLIDNQGRVLSISSQGYDDFNLTEEEVQAGDITSLSLIDRVSLDTFEVLAKMTSGQRGVRKVALSGTNRYIAYSPVPLLGYSLGLVVPENEAQKAFIKTKERVEQETRSTFVSITIIISGVLALALLASYLLGSTVTSPIGRLTTVAEEIAAGNFDARANIKTRDEIGILSDTFHDMGARLRELVSNLENLVSNRTKQLERRASQIQAAAEVGSAVASMHDLESLLNRTTQLISDRFGFYHIGIFLLNERKDFAVLRASNSTGGARMLAREHKLKVGEMGIVGTVTGTGVARIALDVGQDAVYFDNPDLPETRSEMALPLIAGTEIFGALDVQSKEANAFSDEDISTLSILADQVATAIQNTRFFAQTQEALEATRRAYGEQSRQGWQSLLEENKNFGYISHKKGELFQTSKNLDPDTHRSLEGGIKVTDADQRTLYLPIRVRGKLIGSLRLTKQPGMPNWLPEEIEDVSMLANQISNTLDSARIYQETQRKAAIEKAIGDMAVKISAATKVDLILETTLDELRKNIQSTDVIIQLSTMDEA